MFIRKGFVVFYNDQGDSDTFCEWCIGDEKEYFSIYPQENESSDTPTNCSQCHAIIDSCLTDRGITYVINALKESIEKDDWDRMPATMGYYENSPKTEVVADWVRLLKYHGYQLTKWQEFIVDAYLDWVPDADFWLQIDEKNREVT